ncbi:MAG TPA: hypothetical protein VEI07_04785 [Planctomycetaceae bacterium]|nr:hypothetical protein [Planctomycetaceae bacterium]
MNRPVWGILLLISMIVAAPGCSSDSKESGAKSDATGADSATAGTAGSAGGATTHLLSENIPKRTSMEGRWILVFYERVTGIEVPAALLEISKASGGSKLKAIVKGFSPILQNPRLRQAVATENSVHLALDMTVQQMGPGRTPTHETKMLDVLVDLRDGLARGSGQFEPHDAFVVIMVPTEVDNIQSLRPMQLPEAVELQGSKDMTPDQAVDKVLAFVHAHPESPLTIESYKYIFHGAAARKLEASTVEAEADKYAALAERWSPRLGFKARIDVATGLITTGYLPEVALKEIDISEHNLTEDRIPVWKAILHDLREAATSSLALTQIRTGTPAEKAKAADNLRGRVKEQPYNPLVLYLLGQYDEQQGKKKEALERYAELTVLPLLDELLDQVLKSESVTKPAPAKQMAQNLWKDLHGGKLDGFDAYLDQVYAGSMPKWKGARVEPRTPQADNRVVLCELFTGADCGPCVAADIAFSHLLQAYAPSEVIALQYHEHIPHPDALANSDSEQRFQFYFPERGGTPTFAVSGKPVQAGGLLSQADDVYKVIRGNIGLMLQRKTSVRIHLKAEPKEGAVAVTAEAEGSFSPDDPVRLRLVLAEERVEFRGTNGIRESEMVVRAMPGGTGGVDLKDGKLRYEGKVDLKSIKRQLDDYLRAYEEAQKMTFSNKPLDLSHLRLVAFVQNDQTKEVYQAATIPFPSGPAPATAPKSQASAEKGKQAAPAVSKASP